MSIFNRFFGKKNNPTVDSDINKIDVRSRYIAFVDTEVGLKDHKIGSPDKSGGKFFNSL